MTDLYIQFGSLPMLLQVFWTCAVVASCVFLVQTVLTLIGIDADGTDADFDPSSTLDLGGGINLFTIKNLMGFLTGFGWTGVCFWDSVPSRALLILLALAGGSLIVTIFVFIYKQARKLEHNGAFRIESTLDKTADVYLRIPEGGRGKIQISINGSVQELDAISDSNSEIPTGAKVRVTDIIDHETVRVRPINE
jgi:hypothetical protein